MGKLLQFRQFAAKSRILGRILPIIAVTCAVATAVTLKPASSQPASPLVGLWIDHTGRGAVEISTCGTSLCGHIAWLKEPNQPDGKPLVDKKGRPVCGLQILGEVKRKPDGSWDDGWIYDPEEDAQYSLELTMKGADTLQVVGYLGVKMLGETFVWKRAAASQPRCKKA